MDPEVLIADEPLSSLDVSTAASIATMFEALQRELSIATLFISHDLAAVRRLASTVAVMYAGQIVESGPVELLDAPAHPYTRLLVAATPGHGRPMNLALVEQIDAVTTLRSSSNACSYRVSCADRAIICATAPALESVSGSAFHSARCHLCRA